MRLCAQVLALGPTPELLRTAETILATPPDARQPSLFQQHTLTEGLLPRDSRVRPVAVLPSSRTPEQ